MIRGEPLTAIIPVRGGSKGLPGKNLLRIGRDTLLERAIKLALACSRVERVIVSTDDQAMHDIARTYGVASRQLRPHHLATDTATTADVVSQLIEEEGISSGYLVLLQATSPLRKLEDFVQLCDSFETSDCDAAVSLVQHDEPRPEKLKCVVNTRVVPFMAQGFEGPRQSLAQIFALNGAFYLIALSVFLKERRFLPENTLPFLMPKERSANLDTLSDWQVLQAMIAAGHWSVEEYPHP